MPWTQEPLLWTHRAAPPTSCFPPAGGSTIQGSIAARNRERKKTLAAAKREEEARLQALVDEWFAAFDTDGNKQLDREELRKLLENLYPDAPPDEVRAASMAP